ncbi:MAG: thrombospondin type 3 repeat-containing protein [Deltaproteobacteria bacterium]|nr:thrombospondin type 3 repeat-containing protein [Deltaproteobacteria bacterium]
MRDLDLDPKWTLQRRWETGSRRWATGSRGARRVVWTAMALTMAGVAGPAVADPQRIDVGVMTGLVAFDERSGLGNAFNPKDVPATGPLLGATVGTRLLDGKVGAEAQFRVVASTLRSGDASAKVFGWRLHALYHLLTEGPVAAFATVGIGQEVLFNGKPQCPASGAQPAGCMLVKSPDADKVFALGAGASLPLTTRWSLRAQLLYLGADGRPGVAKVAHDFEGTVGATYRLGGAPDDADKDGLPDDADKCPNKAEDKDGFEDGDGCPEDDNDNDGVFDVADKCPTVAEDRDGFEDGDGCPDPDNDQDGVPDASDKCPDKPETKNGFQDEDGCPDVADTDGDGILLPADKCPNQPEDKDGFEDDDGCPELDNDRDGIIDTQDKCPNQPETKNNYQDEDGCPDKLAEAVARLFDAPVTTLEFKGDKLQKGSDARLTPLLEFMLEQEAVKVHVSVQPDAGDEAARKVAQARADAIKAWLTEQGIDDLRVGTAVGQPAAAPPKVNKGVSKPVVALKLL